MGGTEFPVGRRWSSAKWHGGGRSGVGNVKRNSFRWSHDRTKDFLGANPTPEPEGDDDSYEDGKRIRDDDDNEEDGSRKTTTTNGAENGVDDERTKTTRSTTNKNNRRRNDRRRNKSKQEELNDKSNCRRAGP